MFFETKDTIPTGLGFKAFGPAHILWLLAALLFCVAACILFKKLDGRKQKRTLVILGATIFLLEILKAL